MNQLLSFVLSACPCQRSKVPQDKDVGAAPDQTPSEEPQFSVPQPMKNQSCQQPHELGEGPSPAELWDEITAPAHVDGGLQAPERHVRISHHSSWVIIPVRFKLLSLGIIGYAAIHNEETRFLIWATGRIKLPLIIAWDEYRKKSLRFLVGKLQIWFCICIIHTHFCFSDNVYCEFFKW